MGTPRQGALVPNGRGYVQLDVTVKCVVGLEGYSHAWLIFGFHANTNVPCPPMVPTRASPRPPPVRKAAGGGVVAFFIIFIVVLWLRLRSSLDRPDKDKGPTAPWQRDQSGNNEVESVVDIGSDPRIN